MSRTVADQIGEILAAVGVRRVYGVVGDSLNGITDSLRRQREIEWVHVRHEEAGAFAAGAEAHLTGQLAVCAGSCGPGNLHLINGLFDCHRNRVPVLALGAKLQSPMVHALRGKEHVEWGNPYDVGMTGLIGFSSGYYAMKDCDTLLMLGTDFPYRQFYPEGEVHIAQIDIRPQNLGRRAPIELGLVGDVAGTIAALLPRLDQKKDTAHLDDARRQYQEARKDLDELAQGGDGKRAIHPQQIARVLSDLATEDAVFTCDVGLPTVWAARYLAMNGKRRLIGSFWHGSMANAMPQPIGPHCAYPGRPIIPLSGDGGFTILICD